MYNYSIFCGLPRSFPVLPTDPSAWAASKIDKTCLVTEVYFSGEFSAEAHSVFKWHLMIGGEVVVAVDVVAAVVAAAVVIGVAVL